MSKPADTTTKAVVEKYYSTKYVAEMFDVTGWTVREWLKAGILQGIKINGIWKVTETELTRFIRERHG